MKLYYRYNLLFLLIHDIVTVWRNSFQKLTDKINWCICDAVYQTKQVQNTITTLDLTFGKIVITNNSDSISYKFKPAPELEEAVKTVILDNVNPLKATLEKNLINRITNTYKDIII